MNKRISYITRAAVIGTLYAVLTLLCASLGIAYGGVQFRFSEALCILPLFTGAAVPGLTVGCFVANIFSSVNPIDMLVGSFATFISALIARSCRNITLRGYPLPAMLCPVLFNGLLVGAEIAFFTAKESFFPAFILNGLSVAFGEAVVIFSLGTLLFVFISKNSRLKELIGDK